MAITNYFIIYNSISNAYNFFPDAVPADIALLIVNALYFKAPWNLKFDAIPELKPFTLTNGTKVLTKMMVGDSKNYASSTISIDKIGEITALSVPYKVLD